jgi:hypothetical protein
MRGALEQELSGLYDIEHVQTLEEIIALSKRREEFSAILVDYNDDLSSRSFELLEEVDRCFPNIPSIAVAETAEKGHDEHASFYSIVTKPWSRGDILRAIEEELKRNDKSVNGTRLFPSLGSLMSLPSAVNCNSVGNIPGKFLFWTWSPFAWGETRTWGEQKERTMSEQEKWMSNVMNMARMSIEAGMQSMDTFQAQAEKVLDMAMNNVNVVQEETHKAMDSWMENVKKAREVYVGAIEEGLVNFQKQAKNATKVK